MFLIKQANNHKTKRKKQKGHRSSAAFKDSSAGQQREFEKSSSSNTNTNIDTTSLLLRLSSPRSPDTIHPCYPGQKSVHSNTQTHRQAAPGIDASGKEAYIICRYYCLQVPPPPIHSSASSASSSSLADARPGRTPKPAWSSRIFTTGSDSSQIITILAISIHLFDDTHEEMHVNTRTARRWSFDWTDCSDTLIQFLDSTKLVIIVNQSREGLDRRSSLCPSQRSSGRTATAVVWESGSVRASAGCLRLVGLVAFGPCWFGLWLFGLWLFGLWLFGLWLFGLWLFGLWLFGLWLFGLWLFGLCLARALFGSGFVWLGLCSTRALFDSGLALRLFLLVLVALSG